MLRLWLRAAYRVVARFPNGRMVLQNHDDRETLGAGSIVSAMATVDVDARTGELVYVSLGAVVAHDAWVGDGASIGPNAVVCGAARVGECAAIGAGAILLQGRRVGVHAVVGAGAVVTRDVPDYAVAYGAPARVMRQRQAGESYL